MDTVPTLRLAKDRLQEIIRQPYSTLEELRRAKLEVDVLAKAVDSYLHCHYSIEDIVGNSKPLNLPSFD